MKLNPKKFELLRYGKEQEIQTVTTYKSHDDSNINSKEQVRDLGIMMRNTATFTDHIRNIVKKTRDKMGCVCVLSVSVADTLEVSRHFPTRVLLPALESMEGIGHRSYRSFSSYLYVCYQLHTKSQYSS